MKRTMNVGSGILNRNYFIHLDNRYFGMPEVLNIKKGKMSILPVVNLCTFCQFSELCVFSSCRTTVFSVFLTMFFHPVYISDIYYPLFVLLKNILQSSLNENVIVCNQFATFNYCCDLSWRWHL